VLGGGSVPGTPPSVTCSVHAEPDQYRCSCRPEGSISQPGAMPVKGTLPDDPSTASDDGFWEVASVNELAGAETLGCPRCLRRRDGSTRIAKKARRTTRKSQEP
jgi:hypothetical protein